jgi:VCBS repeat-containing protein
MQALSWKKTIVISIIFLFFGTNFIPFVNIVKADIIWDVTLNFNETGGKTDYAFFGEAPDANDGPPVDSYDVAKPPAPIPSYIRAYFKDNLPTPYTSLWKDYRNYPDTEKTWNLSIQWVPEDGESPSTITISWSTVEVDESEYTTVNLCTDAGVVLKNMFVDTSYSYGAVANVIQKFKIICATASNQPPVANPDSYGTNEDTTLTIAAPGVLGNDNDPDSDPLTAVKQSDPAHGNVTLNSNGGYTYIPTTNYFGSDSFTYKAYDGDLYSDTTTVTIDINTVNDAPVVTNIPDQTIAEGSAFSMITLDNFVSDVDNTDAQMTWTYSGNVQLAVSIVNRVATITIPNVNWYGSETITFRATDPGALWDEDSATFTVTNVNDAPVVADIPGQTITEGSTFVTITLDNFVSDVDNTDAQMTWSYSGNSQLSVSIVNRVASITTPSEDWNGAETITFRATDPGALWDDDAATFTVTAVNAPPIVSDIPGQTISEGSSFSTIALDNFVTDADNTDAQMTWTYSGNTQLTVSIVNRIATITIPNTDWYGSETIMFRATDPGALWDEDSATFTVTNVNDAPVVADISGQTIAEGSSFTTITLDNYVTDSDNSDSQMTWTYSGNVQLLVSIVNRVATITTPNVNWYGSETITFRATDSGGLWDDDSAIFTVTAVNDPPMVSDIPNQAILKGSTFSTITFDNYVSDVDNTDAQMTWTYSGNVQLLVNIVNRVATITVPNIDWVGSETITFRATDSGGLWDDDFATFTVTSDNAPPNTPSNPTPVNAASDVSITIDLGWSGGDPDGDSVLYDVYFGTSSSPSIMSHNQSGLSFDCGTLGFSTLYYWKIVSRDTHGVYAVGPLWHFTTSNAPNSPPNPPNSPVPANGTSTAAITSNLHWSGGDPDGDTVVYDVYFGTSSSPSIISHNQSALSYDLTTLGYSTTYYWMIAVWDTHNATTIGPLWHFTTASQSSGGGGGGGGSGGGGEEPPVSPPNMAPVANASAGEPYQGFIDSEILFNGSYCYDADGNITVWFWDFGDTTNGTGVTVTHAYTQKGTYTVTLTVTDDDGATNTDTTICAITQPNRPPTPPSITGPPNGTKNTLYTYAAVSTDADNDTIQYSFDWGDSLIQPSSLLSSGVSFAVDHSWAAAGHYYFTVVSSDNQTMSSSEYEVYIDAVPVEGIGYLLDNDSDGVYDAFYSEELQQTLPIQIQQDQYRIDSDGDGDWDATYSTTKGLSSYQEPTRTYGLEIVIALLAIALYLVWRRRSKKEK